MSQINFYQVTTLYGLPLINRIINLERHQSNRESIPEDDEMDMEMWKKFTYGARMWLKIASYWRIKMFASS